jgi:DNA mismatch repair protein MutS2
MSHLLEVGVTTLVTTHHPDLKAYAHTTSGVMNASVEFDLKSLRPTYHLTVGLPGRSNALAIAKRLGLPEGIVKKARGTLDPADLQADDLLEDIHRQRELAEEARKAAERAREEAETLRLQLADRLFEIEEERQEVLEETRRETRLALQDLQTELKNIRSQIENGKDPGQKLGELGEETDQLEQEMSRPLARRKTVLPGPIGPIREGDRVYLRSLGKRGIVLSVDEEDVEVQVGNIRVRAQKADLEHAQESDPAEIEPQSQIRTPKDTTSPGIELDLRGQRVDEALKNLEYYLDKAFLAGLPWVRIIHGMGTGTLRKAVREKCASHPQVKNFESGRENEGGDGVTVISFQK